MHSENLVTIVNYSLRKNAFAMLSLGLQEMLCLKARDFAMKSPGELCGRLETLPKHCYEKKSFPHLLESASNWRFLSNRETI